MCLAACLKTLQYGPAARTVALCFCVNAPRAPCSQTLPQCAAILGTPVSGCVLRQSVVDRADRENPPPVVAEAKAVLAAQIEAARSKAPVPAQEATAEE